MNEIYIPDFEPIGHLYHGPDGTPMDSVTTIIKAETGGYQYKDNYPAERGTAVHRACHLLDDNDLDEVKLAANPDTQNIPPYLEQYKLALAQHKIVVLQNEMMRYHPVYKYAGTLDKLARVDGHLGIIDIKTGIEMLDHKWQLAAYKDMVKHEHRENLRRWVLYLRPDKFKFFEHTGATDFQEFLALYAAHNIKLRYGFRKRKVVQEE